MSSVSTPWRRVVELPTRAHRQFRHAVTLSLAAVLFGCVVYAIEKFAFAPRHRFIENPTEVMVRCFGLAHFLVGWLFLLTSPAIRSPIGVVRVIAWTGLGVLLCAAYHEGGAGKNSWLVLGFYALFLVHEIRDQAELFALRSHGLFRPNDPILRWLCACFLLGLLAVLLAGHVLHSLVFDASAAVERVAGEVITVGLGTLFLGSALAGARFFQLGRRRFSDTAALLAHCEPLLGVYAGLTAILLLGTLLGSAALNLIILIHVMTWLLCVQERLATTAPPGRGLWHWLRRTRSGFLTLHLALAVGVLILLALRVHLWQRAGVGSKMLSASSFPYWSLLHIAISFAKRP